MSDHLHQGQGIKPASEHVGYTRPFTVDNGLGHQHWQVQQTTGKTYQNIYIVYEFHLMQYFHELSLYTAA